MTKQKIKEALLKELSRVWRDEDVSPLFVNREYYKEREQGTINLYLIGKIADLQYQINELRSGLTVSSAANSAEGISYKTELHSEDLY